MFPEPARRGSLSKRSLRALRVLHEFMHARQRNIEALLGRRAGPDLLRDEILRTVVLNFAKGEVYPISHYQRECVKAGLGAKSSVREAIRELTDANLVLLHPKSGDSRALCVTPTQRLMDFYDKTMARMVRDALDMVKHVNAEA